MCGLSVLLKINFLALKSEIDFGRIYTPKSTSQILKISAQLHYHGNNEIIPESIYFVRKGLFALLGQELGVGGAGRQQAQLLPLPKPPSPTSRKARKEPPTPLGPALNIQP